MKGPEHGIVVVGVRQDNLALELGLQKVVKLLDRQPVRLCRVRHDPPGDVKHAVPSSRGRVLGLCGDAVEALRFVVEERPLLGPARVVVQGLQDDAVGRHGAPLGQLLVQARIVILGHVDRHVERHSWEARLKRCLGRVLLCFLITAVPDCHNSSLCQRGLVQLFQRSRLRLRFGLESKQPITTLDCTSKEYGGEGEGSAHDWLEALGRAC